MIDFDKLILEALDEGFMDTLKSVFSSGKKPEVKVTGPKQNPKVLRRETVGTQVGHVSRAIPLSGANKEGSTDVFKRGDRRLQTSSFEQYVTNLLTEEDKPEYADPDIAARMARWRKEGPKKVLSGGVPKQLPSQAPIGHSSAGEKPPVIKEPGGTIHSPGSEPPRSILPPEPGGRLHIASLADVTTRGKKAHKSPEQISDEAKLAKVRATRADRAERGLPVRGEATPTTVTVGEKGATTVVPGKPGRLSKKQRRLEKRLHLDGVRYFKDSSGKVVKALGGRTSQEGGVPDATSRSDASIRFRHTPTFRKKNDSFDIVSNLTETHRDDRPIGDHPSTGEIADYLKKAASEIKTSDRFGRRGHAGGREVGVKFHQRIATQRGTGQVERVPRSDSDATPNPEIPSFEHIPTAKEKADEIRVSRGQAPMFATEKPTTLPAPVKPPRVFPQERKGYRRMPNERARVVATTTSGGGKAMTQISNVRGLSTGTLAGSPPVQGGTDKARFSSGHIGPPKDMKAVNLGVPGAARGRGAVAASGAFEEPKKPQNDSYSIENDILETLTEAGGSRTIRLATLKGIRPLGQGRGNVEVAVAGLGSAPAVTTGPTYKRPQPEVKYSTKTPSATPQVNLTPPPRRERATPKPPTETQREHGAREAAIRAQEKGWERDFRLDNLIDRQVSSEAKRKPGAIARLAAEKHAKVIKKTKSKMLRGVMKQNLKDIRSEESNTISNLLEQAIACQFDSEKLFDILIEADIVRRSSIKFQPMRAKLGSGPEGLVTLRRSQGIPTNFTVAQIAAQRALGATKASEVITDPQGETKDTTLRVAEPEGKKDKPKDPKAAFHALFGK